MAISYHIFLDVKSEQMIVLFFVFVHFQIMCGIHGSWFDCVKNVNSSRTQRFDRSSGFLFMFYFLTQFVCKFEQMILQTVFFSKTKYTF